MNRQNLKGGNHVLLLISLRLNSARERQSYPHSGLPVTRQRLEPTVLGIYVCRVSVPLDLALKYSCFSPFKAQR